MGKLAITNGKPVRTKPFPAWPTYSQREARGIQKVLASRNWGGYPFPNQIAGRFADHLQRADHCILMEAAVQERGLVHAGHERSRVTRSEQHIQKKR